MKHKIHLNLTRWLILFSAFIGLTYFLFYEEVLFPAACGLIASAWIFFYARPPSICLLDNEIEFSLYGSKIKIPYSAISVSIVTTNNKIGTGVKDIIRPAGIYSLKWIYWLVLFSGIAIFVAITLKEGYSFKIARASVGFVIAGFIFIFLMQTIKNKILSIKRKSSALNIFINKSHLNSLNKWPFSYYKTRWFIYQLDLISYINKNDLLFMIKTFKEKLSEKNLHENVLEYEKQLS